MKSVKLVSKKLKSYYTCRIRLSAIVLLYSCLAVLSGLGKVYLGDYLRHTERAQVCSLTACRSGSALFSK